MWKSRLLRLSVPDKPDGFCGRKATLRKQQQNQKRKHKKSSGFSAKRTFISASAVDSRRSVKGLDPHSKPRFPAHSSTVEEGCRKQWRKDVVNKCLESGRDCCCRKLKEGKKEEVKKKKRKKEIVLKKNISGSLLLYVHRDDYIRDREPTAST